MHAAMYHQQSPSGVVEEDGRREDEHCEANDAIELARVSVIRDEFGIVYLRECWQPLLSCFVQGSVRSVVTRITYSMCSIESKTAFGGGRTGA